MKFKSKAPLPYPRIGACSPVLLHAESQVIEREAILPSTIPHVTLSLAVITSQIDKLSPILVHVGLEVRRKQDASATSYLRGGL